jgi:hypothetical protein
MVCKEDLVLTWAAFDLRLLFSILSTNESGFYANWQISMLSFQFIHSVFFLLLFFLFFFICFFHFLFIISFFFCFFLLSSYLLFFFFFFCFHFSRLVVFIFTSFFLRFLLVLIIIHAHECLAVHSCVLSHNAGHAYECASIRRVSSLCSRGMQICRSVECVLHQRL